MRASDELQEKEARCRAIVECQSDAICRWLPDTTLTFANRSYRELFGIRQEEIGERRWIELVPEFERQEMASVYRERVGSGARDPVERELTVKLGEGDERVFSWVDTPLFDAEGRCVEFQSVGRDITRQWQAEEELRRNEARLRGLVEIHQYKADTTQEYLDHALARAIDLTESTIGYIYFYHEDRQQFVLNTWSKGVMDECSVATPSTLYDLAETGMWGEAVRQRRPIVLNDFHAPHPLKKGYPEGHAPLHRFLTIPVFRGDRIVAVVGVANKASNYEDADVLQLTLLMDSVWKGVGIRESEQALKESEERYRMLAEATQDIILLCDEAGRVSYLNQAGLNFAGLTAAEAEGRLLAEVLLVEGPDDAERLLEKKGTGKARSHRHEAELVNRAGGRLSVEMTSTFVELKGAQAQTLLVARDITERRQAEEDRERLQKRLVQAQKMEAVGRLAGGVAHDFNNMLSVILGQTDYLIESLGPGNAFSAELLEVRSAAQRSAELTRQLLAFARRQPIAPKILDLNATVEGALRLLRRLIGEDIELRWQPKAEVWPVKMDPTQIDQILTNLCVNARDGISGVGKITIETGTVVLDEAYCTDHAGFIPGEFTLLSVSDTGSGMDEQTLSRLFEPFFTTKGLGKGTGLGLATVYGIVKQNDGFINVYSEPSQGSTFRVYLPRHRAQGEERIREVPEAGAPGGHETVLLVEDEPAVLKLTRRILERLGYSVRAASNPDEAMRVAEEHAGEIHLLLTDVVMPGMNGRELAMRLQDSHPNLKCLFMSGYPADVIAHRGVLEEGVEFIQKPFSVQDLAGKVRVVLEAA